MIVKCRSAAVPEATAVFFAPLTTALALSLISPLVPAQGGGRGRGTADGERGRGGGGEEGILVIANLGLISGLRSERDRPVSVPMTLSDL